VLSESYIPPPQDKPWLDGERGAAGGSRGRVGGREGIEGGRAGGEGGREGRRKGREGGRGGEGGKEWTSVTIGGRGERGLLFCGGQMLLSVSVHCAHGRMRACSHTRTHARARTRTRTHGGTHERECARECARTHTLSLSRSHSRARIPCIPCLPQSHRHNVGGTRGVVRVRRHVD